MPNSRSYSYSGPALQIGRAIPRIDHNGQPISPDLLETPMPQQQYTSFSQNGFAVDPYGNPLPGNPNWVNPSNQPWVNPETYQSAPAPQQFQSTEATAVSPTPSAPPSQASPSLAPPSTSPTIYSPPPNATSTTAAAPPNMSSFMTGAGGGGLPGINNIPAFSGANGGSFNIEGVGSVTNGNDIPAYQAQLALQGQNTSSIAQMLASLFGSQTSLQSALGTAQIGADTSRYNADKGLEATGLQTGAQRYGADQSLAGIQAQAAAQRAIAETNAAAQRYAAEQANVPAQLQNARITGTMVPLFQQLLSQYGPGGGSGSSKYMAGALSSFTPQQQQAALNASDAAVERARERALQDNALHYAGNGYGASSPQVMARNAAIDATSAGNAQAGQRQINQDFGTNRSANWIQAMNAQQGSLNPILALFGQLLG